MSQETAWPPQMLRHTNSWRGVELAGWTAFLLTVCSVIVFTFATDADRLGKDITVPSLLYPYLAAASVFVTTCVWILFAARVGVTGDLISGRRFVTARRWFWVTFILVGMVLLMSGLAGEQGMKAAKSLNWYLFGPLDDPWQTSEWYTKRGMPFALLTVIANSLALATLVYLGTLCNGLILDTCEDKQQPLDPKQRHVPHPLETVTAAALRLGEGERRLKTYLVMASALMVTSTLALYLSFAAADQVEVLRDAHAKRLSPGTQPAAPAPTTPVQSVTVDCTPSSAVLGGQHCTLGLFTAEKAARPAASAAYMALVSGLSFTGVLFILFTACGSVLNDRAAVLAGRQLHAATAASPFHLKDWREQVGLADGGAGDQVIQGLALVAPALTGLLTLVNS